MSFNHQWHNYDVAHLWPRGSVVLLRIQTTRVGFHNFNYLLINNWDPDNLCWNRKINQFQLVEEPRQKEKQ